ncbi:hypothetical protein [[Acholeplasma] multilocale]|uniref:hypothetical protein n=1 Tax=[Acholeplasma] multilocale TaxID=264638 RepID=UPI00047E8F3D|nr:hypothetical protein [[Acholeplasma] multilocale]
MGKIKKELGEFRSSQKRVHEEEVSERVRDTYYSSEHAEKMYFYRETIKFRWWSYLIALAVSAVSVGLSFLLGYLLRNNPNLNEFDEMPGWGATKWMMLMFWMLALLVYMTIAWVRNHQATKHFNDRRRRYQKMMTEWEARILHVKKIVFLSMFISIIPLVLTFTIL